MNFEHGAIYIESSLVFGRGVYGKWALRQNTEIAICELLVLSEKDTPIINSTDLKYYTFKYNETQDCLVLGIGEIFNHSNAPNVKFELKEKDGRKLMVFTMLKTVEAGQQLFIDYNSDVQVDTSEYTVNLTEG